MWQSQEWLVSFNPHNTRKWSEGQLTLKFITSCTSSEHLNFSLNTWLCDLLHTSVWLLHCACHFIVVFHASSRVCLWNSEWMHGHHARQEWWSRFSRWGNWSSEGPTDPVDYGKAKIQTHDSQAAQSLGTFCQAPTSTNTSTWGSGQTTTWPGP